MMWFALALVVLACIQPKLVAAAAFQDSLSAAQEYIITELSKNISSISAKEAGKLLGSDVYPLPASMLYKAGSLTFKVPAPGQGPNTDRGYCHEGGVQLNYAAYSGGNWMAKLGNTTTLSQISMPGSHDTMTLGGASWGALVQTQTMNLIEQLYSGIRMVDMRLVHVGNAFVINHASFYLHANFDDVLTVLTTFLTANPMETVLMRAKKEASITNEDQSKDNSRTFDQTFAAYEKTYASIMQWNYTGSSNPALLSIRGKVVVLQDYDGDVGIPQRHIQYSSFATIEDAYSLSTIWDLYSKWRTIQNNLAQAASGPSTTTYVTYLSASGGVAPFCVVSGKTLSGTHSNQLLVRPTPYRCSNGIYADFFNTKCVLGFKYISFKGTNMLVNDFLSTRKQRVGIVMTDFPGGDLLSKIIAMNF